MMTYFPSYQTVSPYIRTAIGISNRTEDYIYSNGSKAIEGGNDISDLAYQVSIGTRFNLSPNAGFYIEAGYGKYIVNGGLTFRF
jgi:predicted porin